ncbi:MAG: STAS/SEC14 domain-containing protein [Mariprofundaceae bacterium]
MGIDYHIDREANMVLLTLSGSVSADEFFAYQDACYRDAAFNPGGRELIDARQLKSTSAHFREMSRIHARDQWQAGSKRAMVVSSPLAFGMGMMFKTLSGAKHGEFKIFRNMQEARQWLGLDSAG